MPSVAVGDVFTTSKWNDNLRDNLNKLLDTGHRTLTVAQFAALTGPEGTKGVVAGDEVYLEVDGTNGVLWHFVYESTETTYKWRFIGGPPLTAEVTTDETTTSTSYAALTTAGPAVALPRAGDYDVTVETLCDVATSAALMSMSYDIGGTGAVDADRAAGQTDSAGGNFIYARRRRRKQALTTVTLTSKYKTGAGTAHFSARLMTVEPVRIRHDA
jgi:hypothetical protein